jgi:hypothetical protein
MPSSSCPTPHRVLRLHLGYEVAENCVLVEVHDPVVQHLVIELIKPEFAIVAVKLQQIDLFVLNGNAPEPHRISAINVPIHKGFVEVQPGRRNLLPFEFPPNLKAVAKFVNFSFELFAMRRLKPETADHHVASLGILRRKQVGSAFIAINVKLHLVVPKTVLRPEVTFVLFNAISATTLMIGQLCNIESFQAVHCKFLLQFPKSADCAHMENIEEDGCRR